ncbi:MAG: hypothetical protein A2254_06465 [Ignavibacteria bacterium RIFOXYA2_FULL_35_9]|nr:hypothetical protein [Candidatus Woesearchaeota archaeon]OGU79439.1 MAG: hypothetical protein A2254_06465 [Ignavibacteria bacterium RIFOXYA2_FULL_35_9]
MKKTQYLIIKYVEGSLDLCHTRIKSGRMIKEFRRYLQKKFPNYTFVEIKVEKGRLRVESSPCNLGINLEFLCEDGLPIYSRESVGSLKYNKLKINNIGNMSLNNMLAGYANFLKGTNGLLYIQ